MLPYLTDARQWVATAQVAGRTSSSCHLAKADLAQAFFELTSSRAA